MYGGECKRVLESLTTYAFRVNDGVSEMWLLRNSYRFLVSYLEIIELKSMKIHSLFTDGFSGVNSR